MNEQSLHQILVVLKAIASNNPPNWQRDLKSYPRFNWAEIGAVVVASDDHGATSISWCGHVYTRRSGENKKFGPAIWFSRSAGLNDTGEAAYVRLITFKVLAQAEPLPDYVARALH